MSTVYGDIRRFWKRAPARSGLLLLSCAMVVSLAALNGSLLSNTLWFTPPGVDSEAHFATLGAITPEGDFTTVGQADIEKLDHAGFQEQWTLYAGSSATIALDAKEVGSSDVALVSPNFFELLGVRVPLGESFSATKDGVVLGFSFWSSELGEDTSIIGKSLRVGRVSLPVLGIAERNFRGPDGSDPALYLVSRHFTAIEEIGIPVPESALEKLAEQLPAFNAFVRLPENVPAQALAPIWSVRSTDAITIDLPATPENPRPKMTLGFNAVGFKPGIANGIDLQPGTTTIVKRYILLLTLLSIVLIVLVGVNLWAYWSSRASDRVQEFQVRVAMGATVRNLIAQFATESAPLVIAVAGLSIPLAMIQLHGLLRLEPFSSYFSNRVDGLQASSFVPSFLIVAVMAIVAVIAPFLTLRRSVLGSQAIGLNRTLARSRYVIVFVQWMFIGLVLLVAVDSFRRNSEMTMAGWGGSQNPFVVKFSSGRQREALMQSLRVDESNVSTISTRPLERLQTKQDYYLAGASGEVVRPTIYTNYASTNFSRVLGVPLLAGIGLDNSSSNDVVVSRSVAKAFGLAPDKLVGRSISQVSLSNSGGRDIEFRVVGVIDDIHYSGLRVSPELVAYQADTFPTYGSMLIPHQYKSRLAGAATELHSTLPDFAERISHASAMQEVRDSSARTEIALSAATFIYALVALVLLALGVVAEANILLSQRMRELALKVAIGWSAWNAGGSVACVPVSLASLALFLAALAGSFSAFHVDPWVSAPTLISALVLFVAAFALMIGIRLRRHSLASLLRQS